MKSGIRILCATHFAIIVGISFAATAARAAEEQKCLCTEVEQMLRSVGEKLKDAADKLDLTAEQKSKIDEIVASHADERKALRTERKSLLQDELKALGTILTPEQREKIKDFAEDRIEQARAAAPGLPRFTAARDTLAERAQSAAEKLGLTSEQRQKMIEALSSHADRHAALKARCREAAESEFKAIAAVLNPQQREKARECFEDRVVIAAAAKSVADRLNAVADMLDLTSNQRQQIVETHSQFAAKYRALRSDRKELMQEELKAIAAILTPEQRENVKDFCEDRVTIIQVSPSGQGPAEAVKALKETISERLETVADKLGLSDDQRNKIRGVRAAFADKFKLQRDQRKTLRQQELQALQGILTSEQRAKVKDVVEDHSEEL
jgi:Spy/CpxP family protein refolding chaperone